MVNKLKTIIKMPIKFEKYIDYQNIKSDKNITARTSYLDKVENRKIQPDVSQHYSQFDKFFNR